jgi:hypothetical protein
LSLFQFAFVDRRLETEEHITSNLCAACGGKFMTVAQLLITRNYAVRSVHVDRETSRAPARKIAVCLEARAVSSTAFA